MAVPIDEELYNVKYTNCQFHTGVFTPQIISKQCNYWLKQSKIHVISYWKSIIIPFLKPQTSKGGLRLYFEENRKKCRGHHCCKHFLIWSPVFQSKLHKFWKTAQKWHFFHVFGSILDVFEHFLLLTEKQHTKPKSSSSLKFSASSDTQFAPKGVRLVERNDSGGKYPCVHPKEHPKDIPKKHPKEQPKECPKEHPN